MTGTLKALGLGAGPVQAAILGTVTAVGGGTIRDVLIQRVPGVLSGSLYAIPALVAGTVVGVAAAAGADQVLGVPVAVGAAGVCFAIRIIALRFRLNAPKPSGARRSFAGNRPPAGGRH